METFKLGNTSYIVNKIEEIDESLSFVREAMKKSGKETAMYFASKLLKNGKESKQGGMFYRFVKSGNFVKAL